MDYDLWSSRLAAAKRQYSVQHIHNQNSHSDRLGIDDFEVEDDAHTDFPCPYCCCEDYDIVSLCSHLEDEHHLESKVAVCPICSVKVSREMLNHIILQHTHLFKLHRRRRLHRSAIPNSQSSLLGRDLREAHLQVLLGGGGYRSSNSNASNVVTDSFLSSLVFNFPTSEAEEVSKSAVSSVEDTSTKNLTTQFWKSSFDSLSSEERGQKIRQATARATFMQGVLLSTLFSD